MILAVALLGVAGGLAWLSLMDRVSPLALQVVELESAVGVPLWVPALAVGIIALMLALRQRPAQPGRESPGRDAGPSPRRTLTPPAAPPRGSVVPASGGRTSLVPAGEGWRAVIDERALALPVGPQGRIRLYEVPEVPYTLALNGATREQARVRFALFAELLSGMPTPPVARVRVESSPDVEGPVHKMLTGELARFFAPGSFHVVSRADGADVRFAEPDPRWADRAR